MTLDQFAVQVLFPTLIVFTLGVGYFVGVRPLLRDTPGFKEAYDAEAGFWKAVDAKFGGVKQKLVTVGATIAGLGLVAHDQISSLLSQAGFDVGTLGTQVLPDVPAWVWPLVSISALWLVQRFRNMADVAARANAEALLQSGQMLAAPAPGLLVSTLPSPAPLPLAPVVAAVVEPVIAVAPVAPVPHVGEKA